MNQFATTNSNFKKINYFRHASSYNVHVYQFSAKSGNRSVITVHTNVFAKNRKLHEFATANNFFKKSTLSDMHHR